MSDNKDQKMTDASAKKEGGAVAPIKGGKDKKDPKEEELVSES